MTRIKLEYVHEYRDRHGKVRRYVRRRGFRAVPLPGLPGSPEFMQAYQDAISGPVVRLREPKAGTVAALAAEFFNSTEFANLKPSSQATYRLTLGPILERDGHRLVRDLPADKARKIIQEIGANRPAMANLTRAVLRRMFSFAVTIGQRRDNPFNAVPRYKIGTHHTWTDAELTAYEKRWPLGTRERLAYDALLYTAQRVGDVVRMQRSDIRNGVITVTQQKTGTEVFVPLHPALARSIKAGPAKGLYLIGDRNGRPITRRSLTRLIVVAARVAGLPSVCVAHGLRNAALRRLAEHGATSKEMQAVSGHKSLSEIERYTRQADQQRLARAAIDTLPDKD
jgi:enterobacteria phage integrase